MPRKTVSFVDELRHAIDASDMTRYRLCKMTGTTQAVMSRFMNRKGFFSEASLNRVAAALRLELVVKRPTVKLPKVKQR